MASWPAQSPNVMSLVNTVEFEKTVVLDGRKLSPSQDTIKPVLIPHWTGLNLNDQSKSQAS
jgi:hypothetical protein